MLGNLSPLAKIENILAKINSSTIKFDKILPVNIDVKEKLEAKTYLLQVGKKEMTTKSMVDLEVGKQYWGVMKEDTKLKSLSLSQLLEKPQLLQGKKSLLPNLSLQKLEQLLTSENPKEAMKFGLLEKMTNATSKQEFMTLSNMLQAVNENVFTMLLAHDNNETLFQFKKRKSKESDDASKEDVKIDFYAAFENLGPIEGVVEVIDGVRKLSLYLYYENSLKFLEK
ncbi:MAG TPA: hypothetical protein EYG95_03005, partial [Campylobacterales bacterium]|nr:hypothetical protein [Campylobacterales bacterium]